MTKHRDWTITQDNYWFGFEALHESYEAEQVDGTWRGNYPVFHGDTVQDCIDQIDDWYEDNEDD